MARIASRIAPRHSRFLIAFAVGIAVAALALWQGVSPILGLLSGANALFLCYLGLMLHFARGGTPERLRQHAEQADEGVTLILLLAALAVAVSITAIAAVLNDASYSLPARAWAIVSLPLGWATIHMLAAFHYAHRSYQAADPGLDFPGKQSPDAWDFLYFSYTIGMTAQVSDVVVTSGAMRRTVLVQSVVSFFYNTGILALAINAVVTGAG